MKRQQLFVLIFTFIVGLFAGFYVYVTGFAPEHQNVVPRDEKVLGNDFAIRAEQIGGCARMEGSVCPSFELLSNRSYKYIKAHNLHEETPDPLTGYLPRAEFESVRRMIENDNLLEFQKPGSYCGAASDGIDYKYDVIVDGISYELNSCGTQFYGTALYKEMLKLWEEMAIANTEAELPFNLRAAVISVFSILPKVQTVESN